jgi:hypothetical protein
MRCDDEHRKSLNDIEPTVLSHYNEYEPVTIARAGGLYERRRAWSCDERLYTAALPHPCGL